MEADQVGFEAERLDRLGMAVGQALHGVEQRGVGGGQALGAVEQGAQRAAQLRVVGQGQARADPRDRLAVRLEVLP